MSLDHRLSRWKRPCDKCVPWEHSVTRAMDNVTTHFAVGIAMSLAADVFWHISAQSSDHLLWDPRLYMAEDSAEGEHQDGLIDCSVLIGLSVLIGCSVLGYQKMHNARCAV